MNPAAEPVAMPLPEPYQPDWPSLERATREGSFMTAGVGLLKETATLAAMVAGVVPDEPYGRDDAIRCGLLVRIGRLARMILRDTCDADGEQQLSLFRQLMDGVTTLLYLADDTDGSRHTAFVQDSLIAEREFLKLIQQQQKARGQQMLPIEERLQRSIERTAKAGEVDLSTLPSRASIGWPSAESRAQQLGGTSYPAYRMGSAALHGTWQDIFRNYLRQVDGGFEPNFDPLTPRPQPLFAGSILIIEATKAYLKGRPIEHGQFVATQLENLFVRVRRVDDLHETFLQRP